MQTEWSPIERWGVVATHLLGVVVLSLSSIIMTFLVTLASAESGENLFRVVGGIQMVWLIQIIASLYAVAAVVWKVDVPNVALAYIPLGLLSLGSGLLFVFGGQETITILSGLFGLLLAITNFQTFRMLYSHERKNRKGRGKTPSH
jgi:hypothetical protein